MANLYDMLFAEYNTISVHHFEAEMVEYMAGEVTKAELVSLWGLPVEAEANLGAILDKIDSFGTSIQKLIFLQELAAVNIKAETGVMYTTAVLWATRLGFI